MSFTRVNPSGWNPGDKLTSTQMNSLDTQQSQAIDGAGGGTYTPSATISINDLTIPAGGSIQLASTGRIDFNSGSFLNVLSGSKLQLNGTLDTTIHWGWSKFYYNTVRYSPIALRGLSQSDATVAAELISSLSLPVGSIITGLTGWVDGNGAGGAHGSMPSTKPKIEIQSWTLTDGAADLATSGTVETTVTDPETTTTEYDKLHTIPHTCSITVAANKFYQLHFFGEVHGTYPLLVFYGIDISLG